MRRTLTLVLLVSLLFAISTSAYDYPLTESSIRDAYFLGTHQIAMGSDFLASYHRTIPQLGVGDYKSTLAIETPFAQVAVFTAKQMNYSAQDAVRDFSRKPLMFRIRLEILYMLNAPPDAVDVQVVQGKKTLVPDFVNRSAYFPASDKYTRPPAIGETVELEFKPSRIESSTITISIDTPDDQHVEIEVEMQGLR